MICQPGIRADLEAMTAFSGEPPGRPPVTELMNDDGMVQQGEDLGFGLEAGEPVRSRRESGASARRLRTHRSRAQLFGKDAGPPSQQIHRVHSGDGGYECEVDSSEHGCCSFVAVRREHVQFADSWL